MIKRVRGSVFVAFHYPKCDKKRDERILTELQTVIDSLKAFCDTKNRNSHHY